MIIKMRQLNKLQSILFVVGGILMVIGAGCFAFMWHQNIFCWIFLIGAILFTLMQSMQVYSGRNITIRRLRRIMALSNILFLISGLLMVDQAYQLLIPLFDESGPNGYMNYLTYIYNKWVILMLIACLLECYTTHRISSELKKEDHADTLQK